MASGNDMKAHRSTYEGFINLVKFGTPAVVLITALVIFLITRHH
ncbi:MAG: aa3-type cytochrome c oxidase subunit IV [Sphingomonadales bacterium]|nr:aa3-type cytochrome c oxidase subunit IV [Sphingomonadales bacterium]